MTHIICTAIVCVTVLCWRWMELRHLKTVRSDIERLHTDVSELHESFEDISADAITKINEFQTSNLSKDIGRVAEAHNTLTARVARLEAGRAFGG